jgi:EAL domain-containing protein (putative c-di-GMP-specific phosphodiesterase class I)
VTDRSDGSEAPVRVLLVDDDGLVRRALRRVLGRAGFTVEEAADGARAVEAVGPDRFDVIVSDINMPNLDGIAMLAAVRERDLDLPVVLVTAMPQIETATRAVEFGAFRYLIKPVDPAELIQVVRRAAQVHRLARIRRAAMQSLGRDASTAGDVAGQEALLRRALASIAMHYQPIVDARTGALFAQEALLRTAPTANPLSVIEAADALDRTDELGRAIRSHVAVDLETLADGPLVFLNIHPRDLDDDSLYDPGAPVSRFASRIVLEVTEQASLRGIGDLRNRIGRLRALGYRLAVDDYGVGNAGLSSIDALNPDLLKVDMSLVRDVDRDRTKQTLIRSTIALCRDLEVRVVLEGVERVEELEMARSLGADFVQGYLLSRPVRPFPEPVWPLTDA